jgi:hypothetical protein
MKSLLLALTTIIASWASAQTPAPLKAQAGDWSTEAAFYAQTGSNFLRFGLNDIKVRNFRTNQKALRMRMLATQNIEKTIIVGTQGNMERNIKEGSIFIAPGFEKHLEGSRRVSPYWGAEAVIGKKFYQYGLTNSTNGQTFSQGGNFNSTTKGAYAFGANMFAGVDYYLGKQIFIGAELGYGFRYEQYGESVVTIENNGNQIDQKSVPMGSNFGLALFANPGIRLGIAL